jgi:metal-responsive CopG/Arc/MetJ family transcriptional regulator
MKELRIIGLLITDRIKEAGQTQQTLTKYAHVIKSRLGFHEVTEDVCSRIGVIILQLSGKREECDKLEEELGRIRGLEIQRMLFKL